MVAAISRLEVWGVSATYFVHIYYQNLTQTKYEGCLKPTLDPCIDSKMLLNPIHTA